MTHFSLEGSGEPTAPGRFVDVSAIAPLEMLPGLEFQPVLGEQMLVNFVSFQPHCGTQLWLCRYHDEVSHHSFVLVFEDMAVEHVRCLRVGVVFELHQQGRCSPWRHDNAVLPPCFARGRSGAVTREDLKLNVVDM